MPYRRNNLLLHILDLVDQVVVVLLRHVNFESRAITKQLLLMIQPAIEHLLKLVHYVLAITDEVFELLNLLPHPPIVFESIGYVSL